MKRLMLCVLLLAAAGPTAAQPVAGMQMRPFYVQENPRRQTAIVFVHGGGGSARGTWKHADSPKSWPEWMVGDDAFRDASIFVYEYASPRLDSALDVHQLGIEMQAVLRDQGVLDHQSVVFIAHSLGGLVVRSFLLTFREHVPRVRFVYFLAVPGKGTSTELTRIVQMLSKNPQPGEVLPIASGSTLLRQATDWRVMHSPRPLFPVYCAYEELPTPLLREKIVDMSSAMEGCFEAPEAIIADHRDMVKPLSRNTTPYVLFRDKYRRETTAARTTPPTAAGVAARQVAADFLAKGLAAAAKGNQLGAIEMYREAIRADQNYDRAYFWRGQAYLAAGQADRAAPDLRRALDLNLEEPDRQVALRLLQKVAPVLASAAATQRTRGLVVEAGMRGGESGAVTAGSAQRGSLGDLLGTERTAAAQAVSATDAGTLIEGLFGVNEAARVRATAELALAAQDEPVLIDRILDAARARDSDLAVTLNVLSLFDAIDPVQLRSHDAKLAPFLAAAARRGPQAADQAAALRARVGG